MGIREDVNLLGRTLGQVLREQEGEDFYNLVEEVRSLVRRARGGEGSGELQRLIAGLGTDDAENLVRAFTWYFQLVNLAEEYERVRVLSDTKGVRSQSLEKALIELRERGLSAEQVEALIARLDLGLTFTAHPTEMRRRTVRNHLVEVAGSIPDLGHPDLTEEATLRVAAHIEAMWSTPELRRLKPTVQDEVKGGLSYLPVIAQALPRLQRDLERAFVHVYGRHSQARLPLSFSSWMGGDRDGNPFVTPEATRETLDLHRERARELLLAQIQQAYADLSQDGGGEEPYRQTLRALHNAVRDGDKVDLLGTLEALDRRLREDGQIRSADQLLTPLLTVARTFGQHLVSLDIREHSQLTGAAVATLLKAAGVSENYAELPEHSKLDVLSAELNSRRPLWPAGEAFPDELERAVGPIREVQRAVAAVGPRAFGRYIISMSESVSDILEPLLLAREVGFRILPVPLFETLSDLERAPSVMWELLALPEYRRVLGSDVQEIMLGYSDSNKDAGFLAANWALHEAQRKVSAVCQQAGVPWRFFHGRGTSIGRGGGPASRAILGQPAGTIDAGLRITEQGEALADKYSHPVLAHRNLEQALYGLLLSASRPPGELPDRWTQALTQASNISVQTYRALVEDEHFLPFFEAVTPIHEISRLNIASRPVRRPGAPTLSNLRAIPWVMSWTQNRANLPGWYGLPEALETVGLEAAQEMYREWPFFRSVLDNAQMALAKSDPQIFDDYLTLGGAGTELARRLQRAYTEAVRCVEAVIGGELLLSEPRLKQSIALRNPYIDPIHRIQVELLRRARAEERGLDTYERPLLLSVQGIAAGVRNTG
ncbi:phosphoenolpyruvate carboxylase [Deinococcus irradiatisoli]|uniref:Phosphoenolpyruvate carboxylase n=1 Tax=Deinococcus irradiatisoli TaxID=2202254 RepID=A0A2Z3JKJ7_9DEIO|nr:phosphoenolpyruvate carboxylase [Deinococcus irradiatisoli]AWN23439.1 phosphoenolpyruvate carboxylase [Deinococcus irradiatisoli]